MSKDVDALVQEGFAATGRLYELLFALSQERVELREQVKRLTEKNETLALHYEASQDMMADVLAELTEARETIASLSEKS